MMRRASQRRIQGREYLSYGVYSSALAMVPVKFVPPTTSTWLFGSVVAVCCVRESFILPVIDQRFVEES